MVWRKELRCRLPVEMDGRSCDSIRPRRQPFVLAQVPAPVMVGGALDGRRRCIPRFRMVGPGMALAEWSERGAPDGGKPPGRRTPALSRCGGVRHGGQRSQHAEQPTDRGGAGRTARGRRRTCRRGLECGCLGCGFTLGLAGHRLGLPLAGRGCVFAIAVLVDPITRDLRGGRADEGVGVVAVGATVPCAVVAVSIRVEVRATVAIAVAAIVEPVGGAGMGAGICSSQSTPCGQPSPSSGSANRRSPRRPCPRPSRLLRCGCLRWCHRSRCLRTAGPAHRRHPGRSRLRRRSPSRCRRTRHPWPFRGPHGRSRHSRVRGRSRRRRGRRVPGRCRPRTCPSPRGSGLPLLRSRHRAARVEGEREVVSRTVEEAGVAIDGGHGADDAGAVGQSFDQGGRQPHVGGHVVEGRPLVASHDARSHLGLPGHGSGAAPMPERFPYIVM